MHYDGDVRIIGIILDHIGEGINETVFNHYGKNVTPSDMLLHHCSLNGNSDLIKNVIDLGGKHLYIIYIMEQTTVWYKHEIPFLKGKIIECALYTDNIKELSILH